LWEKCGSIRIKWMIVVAEFFIAEKLLQITNCRCDPAIVYENISLKSLVEIMQLHLTTNETIVDINFLMQDGSIELKNPGASP